MKAEQLQFRIETQSQCAERQKKKSESGGKSVRDSGTIVRDPVLPMSAADKQDPEQARRARTDAEGNASLSPTVPQECRPPKKRKGQSKDDRVPKDCRDPLTLARGGLLFDLLTLYLERCAGGGETSPPSGDPAAGKDGVRKRAKTAAPVGRFPNLAGFCRFLGVGMARMDTLSREEPEIYDSLCAVFEDEALNSGVSASVLTPYFKKRLGYADKLPEPISDGEESGGIRLVFDHDIWEDGA